MADAQAILGAGAVQLNIYDPATQSYSGWGDQIGADKFAITPDSDLKEKTSKRRENYGQAIASLPIGKPTKIAITISAADKASIAIQLQGTLSTFSQGAGAVDETITAKLGKWVSLSKRNLQDTGFAVKNAGGTSTYVLGTDYEVNYATGEVKALASGSIEADEQIKVTGNANAVSGQRIRGGTQVKVRAQVRFVGVNLVDDQPIRVQVWEASMRSTKELDLLADDFNGVELEGTLVIPAGKTEPYVMDFDDAAA